MPTMQSRRDLIAQMKLLPVNQLIRNKSLLLIEAKGITPQDHSDLLGFSSLDEFRTPEGEVIYVLECRQDGLSTGYEGQMEKYAEEYPNMKEYAEQKIEKAKAARQQLNSEGINCLLSYRVVEYTEGIGEELYTGGAEGQVRFAIHTGH